MWSERALVQPPKQQWVFQFQEWPWTYTSCWTSHSTVVDPWFGIILEPVKNLWRHEIVDVSCLKYQTTYLLGTKQSHLTVLKIEISIFHCNCDLLFCGGHWIVHLQFTIPASLRLLYALICGCMYPSRKYITCLKNHKNNLPASLAFQEHMNTRLDWCRACCRVRVRLVLFVSAFHLSYSINPQSKRSPKTDIHFKTSKKRFPHTQKI